MEGVSIIIPVFNKLEITQKCISHIKEFNKKCTFEIIIVDNGSTDETQQFFSSLPFNSPLIKGGYRGVITYIRNEKNLGLSKAYNQASKVAKCNIFCFMHNDVFVFEENWMDKIRNFIIKTPNAGVVGLYGAKTMRIDGSFRGKTIVHSKKHNPSIHKPFEKVAVVDGLLMAMHRSVFEKAGGFNEVFSIHYYDKNISLRVLKNNFMNYVLNISFEHRCATTRRDIKKDTEIRDEAQKQFIEIWRDFLPADVSTIIEKLSCIFKRATS